jgi:hypothetical protein
VDLGENRVRFGGLKWPWIRSKFDENSSNFEDDFKVVKKIENF